MNQKPFYGNQWKSLFMNTNRFLKRYIKFILIFLFFAWNKICYAQPVSSLEAKTWELNFQLKSEYQKLDSLKTIYDERTREIDLQKKKTGTDQNTIKKMMAATAGLSNKIEEQQKKISLLENDLEKVKVTLEKKYSTVIDSLKELKNSNRYSGNKDDLEKEILTVTEKKILVSPRIGSLSYNPERIILLEPGNARSNEERKIYSEYLNEALRETETKLQKIQNINSEVKQIVLLQKKTKKFIEDVEFGSALSRSTLAVSGKENSREATYPNTGGNLGESKDIIQVSTYLYLLSQLDYKMQTDVKSRGSYSFDSKDKNLSFQEYSELLSEVEKRLADYRLILKNKISTFK